jgi:8-oxo-dGTP pyrophosphatase MutT (NUDIX family)
VSAAEGVVTQSKVQLLATRRIGAVENFLRVTEYDLRVPLQAPKAGGPQFQPLTRVDVYRRDSVAGILHIDRGAHVAGDHRHIVCLVRQFRLSTIIDAETGDPDLSEDGLFLELVAGTCLQGEPPLVTFKREAQEETKQMVEDVEYLSSFFPSPGASSERIHLYYARIAFSAQVEAWMKAREPAGYDPGEEITHEFLTPRDFLERVDDGRIADGKAVAAASFMRGRLKKHFSD